MIDPFDDYFVWLARRNASAEYVVTRDPASVPGEVIDTISSDEHVFRPQEVYVVQKDGAAP
jgi:hypothetical protein